MKLNLELRNFFRFAYRTLLKYSKKRGKLGRKRSFEDGKYIQIGEDAIVTCSGVFLISENTPQLLGDS